MKRERLPELTGYALTLRPIAVRLDLLNRTLPEIDDEWLVNQASTDSVEISNARTGHVIHLPPDHIHHFTSAGAGNGLPRAILQLVAQYYLRGASAWFEITRPGTPLPFPEPPTVEQLVDIEYPDYTGLNKEAHAKQIRLGWCRESQLARRLYQGAQHFEQLVDGQINRYVVADSRERLLLIATPMVCDD